MQRKWERVEGGVGRRALHYCHILSQASSSSSGTSGWKDIAGFCMAPCGATNGYDTA